MKCKFHLSVQTRYEVLNIRILKFVWILVSHFLYYCYPVLWFLLSLTFVPCKIMWVALFIYMCYIHIYHIPVFRNVHNWFLCLRRWEVFRKCDNTACLLHPSSSLIFQSSNSKVVFIRSLYEMSMNNFRYNALKLNFMQ